MAEKRIVDIGPLLEDLKNELEGLKGATEVLTVEEAAEDEIEVLKKLPVIDPEKMIPAWRNPDKDPPKVETEVLILYRNEIGGYGITTGHYENGNIFSEDSKWNWEDLPDWGTYDEERDDYRIPEGWLEELAAAARRAGVPLWIKDSEEIRAVIGGEPAQALPDALKRPKDRPTPHCAECEHCIKTQEGQRGTRKDCAIGWTAEGYEDGGARHIPTRGNRQSPDWCPRRKDDAE